MIKLIETEEEEKSIQINSYWSDKNKFENREKLLVNTERITTNYARFDKNNNLIYITSKTILFNDAEQKLLLIGFFALIVFLGVLV